MNPSSQESAGMQLPTPVPEQAPAQSGAELGQTGQAVPEQAPVAAEGAPSAQQAPPIPLPQIALPMPPSTPPTIAQSDDSAAQSTKSSVSSLDDGDLIEKEWVNKAKQIVEANRADPYKQSEELTVFRADYMKKHYDKNIKLSN